MTAAASVGKCAACTVITKNYLAHARVIAESFQRHNPTVPFFVLLADRLDGAFVPDDEPFTLIEVAEIAVPDLLRLAFQYTVFEFSNALKPFFLAHLFAAYGFDKLIYFDSDVQVLGSLAPLYAQLDTASVLLTPHIFAPLPDDGAQPSELNILQTGTYNLGFIAVANTVNGRALLAWWGERLRHEGYLAVERGMHVDQRWIDLVPSFYPDTVLLREPGCNVAYWNLPQRTVRGTGDAMRVNGEPAYFFHFSGFDPEHPDIFSRHENRLRRDAIGDAALLYEGYAALLIEHGYRDVRRMAYAFGEFDNGVPIPPIARSIYADLGDAVRDFDDPFIAAIPGSFYAWLNADLSGGTDPVRAMTRLWYAIYSRRADLHTRYPDPLGRDRDAFLAWAETTGKDEYRIADAFVPTLAGKDAAESARPLRSGQTAFGMAVIGATTVGDASGEAVRPTVRAIAAARIPYALTDSYTVVPTGADETPYAFTLTVLNPASATTAAAIHNPPADGRYHICRLVWDRPVFPAPLQHRLRHFDEIWVASSFVRDALAAVVAVPAVVVPYAVAATPPDVVQQGYAGIPPAAFVVQAACDFGRGTGRDNPLGMIEAFRRAFAPHDDVLLLLHIVRADRAPAALRAVQEMARGVRVRITAGAALSEQRADCFLALHRTEEFGLSLAEAMRGGTPVIATGYGGNTDFMTAENSYLCRYAITSDSSDGGAWAEPDLDHAAALLRHIFVERDAARDVGAQGRRDITAQLLPATVGQTVAARLRSLFGELS